MVYRVEKRETVVPSQIFAHSSVTHPESTPHLKLPLVFESKAGIGDRRQSGPFPMFSRVTEEVGMGSGMEVGTGLLEQAIG